VSPSTGAFFRCLYATPALVLVARAESGASRAKRPVAARASWQLRPGRGSAPI